MAGPAVHSMALILMNVVLLVAGQAFWKAGLEALGGFHRENGALVVRSPWIWAGLAAYGVATLLWFLVLSRVRLSVAYPMQSLAYVLGVVVAWAVFHETVPPLRWLGVGIILAGVAVVAAGQ